MKVVIAGGTGALGSRLADDLAGRGHEVVVLTRSPKPAAAHRQVQWDGRNVGPWAAELSGAALVNLAGEIVDRPPTKKNIQLLTDSRVRPTQALVAASQQLEQPISVWLQGSTLAIYGDAGDAELTEDTPVREGLPQMTGVALPWEAASEGAVAGSKAILRTSIVLAAGSPALDKLAALARFGLGGKVGSGKQWFSWVHIADWLAIARFALDGKVQGLVHATAPNPVRNAEFMAELRRALHRPWAPPSPAFAVRLAAPLLRTDPALALSGRRGVPERLTQAGFPFRFPTLGPALDDLLG
ncbi:domain of unknown function DUF1731 [Segniliparus rotundus DSM 44985]|uniref:NAD-dependent epimerase/dehydratase n=1 Tax=Segniliparus rotundus (strain ATCC BAA-972 / CDC 1076 / CIP 108378 / DSM 44985 / JCM 13578) TaxID=640132 RepID=D6ZCE3_SEGRD|nr:TIGR01777 family oxidoreductase [Segniliparus rotundus]ADG99112.1 domain of unknown function DUF1731 [Segniliparus rotundus DSM 44985]